MEKEVKKSSRKRSKTQPVSPTDDSTSTLNDSDEVNIEPPADGKTSTSPGTKKKKPKKKDETAGSVIVSPRNREPAEGLLSPRRNTESMFSRKRSDTVLSDFEEVLDVADEEGLTDDQVYIAKVMRGIRKGAMYGETLDKLQRDDKELELMKEEDREVMGVQGFIRRDYKDKVLFKFNSPTPGGSRIPLMKKDKVVVMTDYAPRVFHHLRRKCNVPTEDYTKAWTFAKDNLPSPNLGAGRSGSLFVMSSDARFVFKTIPEFEVETLLEILPSIHQHFVDHPESRIIRFLGLHHFYDTITKEETHCIVMNNLLLHPSYAIDEKWDLKGRIPKPGKQGRFADKVDRSKRVLKDNDLLDRRFHLTNEARTDLLQTLNADVEFLKVHNCMDYSLLVGVHFLKEEESAAELAQESAAAAAAVSSSSSPSKDEKKAAKKAKKAKKGKKKAKNPPAAAKSDDNDDASGEAAVPPPLLDGVMGPIHSDMACAREIYFVGIIDPLSRYKLRKKVAHFLKEMFWDADTLSTVPADYYAERYSRYLAEIFVHREPKVEGAPEPEVEQDKVEDKPGPASKPDLPLPAAAEEKKELHEEEEKKEKEVEDKKEKEKKGTLKKDKKTKAKKDEVAAAPAAAEVVAPAPAVVQVVTVRDDSEEAIVVDPVAASVVAAAGGGAVGREVEIKIEEAPAKADAVASEEVAKEKDGDSDRQHNGKEENGGEKKATKGGKKAGKKSAKRTEENGEEVSSSSTADEVEGATVKKEKKSKRDGTLKKDKKTKAGQE